VSKREKNARKPKTGLVSVSISVLLQQGCVSSVGQYETPAVGEERLDVGGDVELFSWWTSGGEEDALSALIAVHDERVPTAEVQNAAVEHADKARDELSRRLQAGIPPDTFQANSGADLFGWVKANGRDASDSMVESLEDMAIALNWKEHFAPAVLESVSVGGEMYAVPLNVHRINSLFYRKDLFEKFSLDVPKSLEALIDLCRRIQNDDDLQRESGPIACLGLGNKWNWTFSQFTFEFLLPAMAGAQFYEDYFDGRTTALAEPMRAVLDQALIFYCGDGSGSSCGQTGWFNSDVNELTWDEGVRKLTDGKAFMAPMGDWAKGYLESDAGGNLVPGKDFDVIAFPKSDKLEDEEDTFVFTADTFPLPRGAANRDGARSLLKTFASVEGQTAFSRLKGSIPARNDIDAMQFDVLTRKAIVAFDESRKVRAMSGLLSGQQREGLSAELGSSLEEGNPAIIRRYLEANYPLQ
jgi:glucose/mannose transport system substrate-binding protein